MHYSIEQHVQELFSIQGEKNMEFLLLGGVGAWVL